MTPEIHRAALRAAAKLALSAVVLGCGGAAADTQNDPGASPTDTSAGDLTSRSSGDVAGYCHKHHAHESQHQCCVDEVATASFPKDPHFSANPDLRVDALTRACCTVLAKDADKTNDFSFKERGECCAAIGWSAAATCTPWGPPVPPEMPSFLA